MEFSRAQAAHGDVVAAPVIRERNEAVDGYRQPSDPKFHRSQFVLTP
jgi:hypothetical protein